MEYFLHAIKCKSFFTCHNLKLEAKYLCRLPSSPSLCCVLSVLYLITVVDSVYLFVFVLNDTKQS